MAHDLRCTALQAEEKVHGSPPLDRFAPDSDKQLMKLVKDTQDSFLNHSHTLGEHLQFG